MPFLLERGQLFQRLLALHIVRYHLGLIATSTAQKLPPAGLAFIQLFSASHAVTDHLGRPAEKAFFTISMIISANIRKSIYCIDFITQNVQPATIYRKKMYQDIHCISLILRKR